MRESSTGWFGRTFQPEDLRLSWKGRAYSLKVRAAPEPGDIRWTNLSTTDDERTIRTSITGLITVVLVMCSFVGVFLASTYDAGGANISPAVCAQTRSRRAGPPTGCTASWSSTNPDAKAAAGEQA